MFWSNSCFYRIKSGGFLYVSRCVCQRISRESFLFILSHLAPAPIFALFLSTWQNCNLFMKSSYSVWKYYAGRLMTHTHLGRGWKKLEFWVSATMVCSLLSICEVTDGHITQQCTKWQVGLALCLTARMGPITTSLLFRLPLSTDVYWPHSWAISYTRSEN